MHADKHRGARRGPALSPALHQVRHRPLERRARRDRRTKFGLVGGAGPPERPERALLDGGAVGRVEEREETGRRAAGDEEGAADVVRTA